MSAALGQLRRAVLCAMVGLCLALPVAACGPLPTASDATAEERQRTVDAVAALTRGLEIPAHLQQENATRDGSEFDPSQLFSVLPHLSMEPGYVLDYVYLFDGMGGRPILYARPADQAPYATYADYSAAVGTDAWRGQYSEHLRADGTADGFFQWVVMLIMGDQFYLYWHANYDDATILCTRNAVEAVLSPAGNGGLEVPAEVQEQARTLNPAPVVEFQPEQVLVKVLIFSKWGGFIRLTYTFDRHPPYPLIDAREETLVPYDCGIQF